MRLIKMIGFAAVAAIAAMAFVGASSAMATGSTAICKANELPCSAANLLPVGGKITSSAGTTELKGLFGLTILCLSSTAVSEVENSALHNPLELKVISLTWNNCGTNAAHDNCTVTNVALPLFDVLHTATGLGTASALGALFLVACPPIGLHCVFGGPGSNITGFTVEGALHTPTAGHGKLIAKAVTVPNDQFLFACPSGTAQWTGSYESSQHLWISS